MVILDQRDGSGHPPIIFESGEPFHQTKLELLNLVLGPGWVFIFKSTVTEVLHRQVWLLVLHINVKVLMIGLVTHELVC